MIGAILGDIIGSRFERRNTKSKDFELFTKECCPTDDSYMTFAVAKAKAFLESESFEDAIRTAVSIGGDSDTIAAMTGALAESFYGVPNELYDEAKKRCPLDLSKFVEMCYK